MPMTPIDTTAKLNQQTGMVLAYYGYDRSNAKPEDLKATLGKSGWVGIDTLSDPSTPTLLSSLGTDYNIQRNTLGKIENSFYVFVNDQTKQATISFKGSDALSNWASDLMNAGASEFAKIREKAQTALAQLKKDYADYQITTVGHSLGGGMALSFALRNNLDVQVYNSLPIANGTVNSGYYDAVGGYDAALARWQTSGRTVDDVRTPNDIATFYMNSKLHIG